MATAKGTEQLNVGIDKALMTELKTFATDRGEKLRAVVEAALRRHMDNPPPLVELPPLPPVPPPGRAPSGEPARKPMSKAESEAHEIIANIDRTGIDQGVYQRLAERLRSAEIPPATPALDHWERDAERRLAAVPKTRREAVFGAVLAWIEKKLGGEKPAKGKGKK